MKSPEIRQKFLKFFEKRGHAIIPSASLVTPDEKGITNPTLFNTAGMQPLIPYLLGEQHPKGKRLVDVQKCVRTVDIDDIGDKTHATFFEMLGNWSLGDYFKKEAIQWSYEFLTSKEEGLGLDPHRLYITVFEGDENAGRDDEAADIWKEIFMKNKIEGERIFYLGAKSNWWEAGENGPCGPDTEMFYDISNTLGGKGLSKEEFLAADEARHVVEVWNDVFMQYEKKDGKIIGKLPKPSVDTGAGLERLCMTMQGVDNIFDTDLFKPVMDKIREMSQNFELKSARIVADHIRTSVFLIDDCVMPSNTDKGYVLRRLIRRAVMHSDVLRVKSGLFASLVDIISQVYFEEYNGIFCSEQLIKKTITQEENKFRETLERGLKEFEKFTYNISEIFGVPVSDIKTVSGVPISKVKTVGKDQLRKVLSIEDAFILFSTYGFPVEITIELLKERGLNIDSNRFKSEFKKYQERHQDLSRTGAEKKFKGGLADTSEMSVKYHTATHLLHQALHEVLGEGVMQKGSNITPERLRFDFSYGAKMTDDEKKKVEEIVNKKIAEKLPVQKVVMSKEEAEKTGARHFFGEKYGDQVSVYFIGKDMASAFSKEFCGGPHMENIGNLGIFKIQKEEAISQGIRRIKAILT